MAPNLFPGSAQTLLRGVIKAVLFAWMGAGWNSAGLQADGSTAIPVLSLWVQDRAWSEGQGQGDSPQATVPCW